LVTSCGSPFANDDGNNDCEPKHPFKGFGSKSDSKPEGTWEMPGDPEPYSREGEIADESDCGKATASKGPEAVADDAMSSASESISSSGGGQGEIEPGILTAGSFDDNLNLGV